MINGSVTLVGNVVTPVKKSVTVAGNDISRFRMVVQPRRFDKESGEWIDGVASYFTVIGKKGLCHNLALSLEVGDPVIVTGRIRVREWESEGQRRATTEIDATSVGHDLCRGVSRFAFRSLSDHLDQGAA